MHYLCYCIPITSCICLLFLTKYNLYTPYSSYSPFFVFSAFHCLYFFQSYSNINKLKQIVYFLLMLLLIYSLFSNPTRAGQLAFIISLLVTIVLFHQNFKKSIVLFLGFTLLITILISSSNKVKSTYSAAINEINEIQKDNYSGSWGARWGLSLTTIEVIKNNPIFGVGIGDTQDERRKIIKQTVNAKSQNILFFTGTHNSYLTILSSAGIICLIFYLLMYVNLYKLPIKNIEMKNLSIIFLTTLIVTSIANDIIFYKPYNIHFALMMALFINLSLDKKNPSSEG